MVGLWATRATWAALGGDDHQRRQSALAGRRGDRGSRRDRAAEAVGGARMQERHRRGRLSGDAAAALAAVLRRNPASAAWAPGRW